MKNDKFKQICHFVAGAILLPTAFKLFEHKKFTYSTILLVAGIIFLIFSATLDWIEKKIGNISKLIFLLESCVLVFAAFIQYKAGKKMPTVAFAAVGIVYFLLFLYYLYEKDKHRKHRKKHSHHSNHHSGKHHSHRHHHHSSEDNKESE